VLAGQEQHGIARRGGSGRSSAPPRRGSPGCSATAPGANRSMRSALSAHDAPSPRDQANPVLREHRCHRAGCRRSGSRPAGPARSAPSLTKPDRRRRDHVAASIASIGLMPCGQEPISAAFSPWGRQRHVARSDPKPARAPGSSRDVDRGRD
jgi:hypothetical protein